MSRRSQHISCPKCGKPMQPRSKLCRKCCGYPGRPRTCAPDTVYARELGVDPRAVRALGGSEKLRALSPEARALLLKPVRYGNSRTVADGGMAARGMKPQVAAGNRRPYTQSEVSA